MNICCFGAITISFLFFGQRNWGYFIDEYCNCHKSNIEVYLNKSLVQDNKGCALTGTKTSNDIKSNDITTTSLNACILCLATIIFV